MVRNHWFLPVLLAASLTLGPGPAPAGAMPPLSALSLAGGKCTEEICMELNLKIIKITMCRSREYECETRLRVEIRFG